MGAAGGRNGAARDSLPRIRHNPGVDTSGAHEPRRRRRARAWLACAALLPLAAGLAGTTSCSSSEAPPTPVTPLTQERLLDPETCKACHAEAYREWSGSMHAYAAEDPIFLAMNARGQRETGGKLGDFCVKCHAPMAVRLGQTKDGTDLAKLPASLKGVTCVFCHTIDAIEGSHDAAVRIAKDGVLRGPIADPSREAPHGAAYSALHDRERAESSQLCGACHDVVTPSGLSLERTYQEWQASVYAREGGLSCGKCHMEGRDGVVATVPGARTRRVHSHAMAAIDVALTPFPEAEAQRSLVQTALESTLITKLCVRPAAGGVTAEVSLDNAFAGHAFPSGVTHDRRVWVELLAWDGESRVFSSGEVPEGKPVRGLADPQLFLLGDKLVSSSGAETHMFWEAAKTEGHVLAAAVTSDRNDPAFYHAVTRSYAIGALPTRIRMRVLVRPIDFDLVADLARTGDLDPAIGAKVPTFDIRSAGKEWTTAVGFRCVD